jgi:hypothetical protein
MNAFAIGWYFVAWDAGDWAKAIEVEIENEMIRRDK